MRFRNLAVLAALAWLLASVATANGEPNPQGAIGAPGTNLIAAWGPLDTARFLIPVIVHGDADSRSRNCTKPPGCACDAN
jgi:hypothetical protein